MTSDVKQAFCNNQMILMKQIGQMENWRHLLTFSDEGQLDTRQRRIVNAHSGQPTDPVRRALLPLTRANPNEPTSWEQKGPTSERVLAGSSSTSE